MYYFFAYLTIYIHREKRCYIDIKIEVNVHAPEIIAAMIALAQELESIRKSFDVKGYCDFLNLSMKVETWHD